MNSLLISKYVPVPQARKYIRILKQVTIERNSYNECNVCHKLDHDLVQ